jgi:dipeptidyl aminopeptidase/acylaminoacyl peptidase
MVIMDAPFGAWESPITSKAITAGSVGIGSLKIDEPSSNQHHLLWIEGRPQEAGRYVLCRYDPDAPERNDRNAVDVTPKDSNVRTRVHEYGGGAVTLGPGGDVFYSEFTTQRLVKLAAGGEPEPITPDGGRFRFADGVYDCDKKCVITVREDHEKPAPTDVVNEVVAVDVDGSEPMRVLATGNDFYAAPRLSPDGTKIAYVTWNHPNMPWDATELRVSTMESEESSKHELIAGHDGDTSIIQPLWHPQSGELYYISDESGYYNIYRAGTTESILPTEKDFGGPAPGWILGQQEFNFLPDGRLVATYTKDGNTRLVVANVSGDGPATEIKEYGIDDGLPMQFRGVIGTSNNDLYFIGGSPSTPTSVYQWSLETRGAARQLACSSSLSFPEDVISAPEQIEFPTTLGTAFGYYYPPCNGKFHCTTESAPPLLVKVHGGPTACTGTSFNAGIQFWTSRGFAVLDVDYGGSTGYGRDYRRRLRGAWGIVDLDDVCAGAQHLVNEGLADPKRLCIDGGSAGGYTTLSALAFRDVFTAGCSLYGVGDLTALAGDTHKFESRYLDGLVGPYPEDEAIYEERSPINSVETLNCPILLLQGDEDKVVPPNQAETMHTTLLNKGIATCIKMYKGEQHGFRKSENIEDALDSELAFYGRVYGINVPGAVEINIDNM